MPIFYEVSFRKKQGSCYSLNSEKLLKFYVRFQGRLHLHEFMHFGKSFLFLINFWGEDFQRKMYLGNEIIFVMEKHKKHFLGIMFFVL